MYCTYCGQQIPDGANHCPNCGQNINYAPVQRSADGLADRKSFGWALLSFLVPIVGIILFVVWKDETPLKAKSCLHGALTSIILSVVASIFWLVMLFGVLILGSTSTANPGDLMGTSIHSPHHMLQPLGTAVREAAFKIWIR